MSATADPPQRSTADEIQKNWPVVVLLVTLAAVYIPVIYDVAQYRWLRDDNTSYGILVPFMVGLLVWWKRDEIIDLLPGQPWAGGFALLAVGLLMEMLAWYVRIEALTILSLVPVLLGVMLLIFGKPITRLLLFPILFLATAAPVPATLIQPVSVPIQIISTNSACWVVAQLGVPLDRNGFKVGLANGASVEVAQECSGFKKTLTVTVMAIFFASLFAVPLWKQVALVLMAGPLAILANIVRVAGLILVGNQWGIDAVHTVHGVADPFVVVLCFALLYAVGRGLGCKKVRYTV